MPSANQDISALNSLIATLLDSVEGYTTPLEGLSNGDLADRFHARALERQRAIMILRAARTVAGGNPEDDGTLVGRPYRTFFDLMDAVDSNDVGAILAEVERGELYLNEMYGIALRTPDLSPKVTAAIRETWETVWQGHADMSALSQSIH